MPAMPGQQCYLSGNNPNQVDRRQLRQPIISRSDQIGHRTSRTGPYSPCAFPSSRTSTRLLATCFKLLTALMPHYSPLPRHAPHSLRSTPKTMVPHHQLQPHSEGIGILGVAVSCPATPLVVVVVPLSQALVPRRSTSVDTWPNAAAPPYTRPARRPLRALRPVARDLLGGEGQ